jgi:hypothetical protein
VAEETGVPLSRIERFAYPVLLERARMAELARAAHPVRDDGPDVRTLAEVVDQTFGARGQDYQKAEWDAWRGEDNRWVLALRWSVGRSDITARWVFQPGSHGGTVTALDEHATDLVDGLARAPRRVGPVVDLGGSTSEHPGTPQAGSRATKTGTGSGAGPAKKAPGDGSAEQPETRVERSAPRKQKPVMPSWEDVLLGVKRT